eukprot:TRINITY_DN5288_c0_g1_i1.p1 TRINITY_DN5288_c0_g1~~TRINITY_DN5288_c0_g1_i1.p1  ORF type:complete len:335 (+),score=56.10 TRINITY_DN5288_c0_g1_i1:36-1007(+)
MSLFEQTIPINAEYLSPIIENLYHLKLGTCIKESQNHTYNATHIDTEQPYIIRITPTKDLKETLARVKEEVLFIRYIANHNLNVCEPIVNIEGEYVSVVDDELVIVVSEYARGKGLDYMERRWLDDEVVVNAWGTWLGELHVLSKKYAEEFPERVAAMRDWDELHAGVMKHANVDERDKALIGDPEHWGVNHSDVNCGNFFWEEDHQRLCVFDWDQISVGWYLYDLAQAIIGGYIFARTNPESNADVVQFERWLVNGYESVLGEGSVDMDALQRMVMLRREFYETFCREAIKELNEGFMYQFCQMIVDWIDGEIAKGIPPTYR